MLQNIGVSQGDSFLVTVVGNPQNVVVSPGDTVFVFLMTVASPAEQ